MYQFIRRFSSFHPIIKIDINTDFFAITVSSENRIIQCKLTKIISNIYAYSFRTMARGWAPSVVPHPWRKKVSTLSHVLQITCQSTWVERVWREAQNYILTTANGLLQTPAIFPKNLNPVNFTREVHAVNHPSLNVKSWDEDAFLPANLDGQVSITRTIQAFWPGTPSGGFSFLFHLTLILHWGIQYKIFIPWTLFQVQFFQNFHG